MFFESLVAVCLDFLVEIVFLRNDPSGIVEHLVSWSRVLGYRGADSCSQMSSGSLKLS